MLRKCVPLHFGTCPGTLHFLLHFMSEQFVCPVCSENIPFVFFDPEACYWVDTDTGDLCIIIGGVLWAVRPAENMFGENRLDRLHGHD